MKGCGHSMRSVFYFSWLVVPFNIRSVIQNQVDQVASCGTQGCAMQILLDYLVGDHMAYSQKQTIFKILATKNLSLALSWQLISALVKQKGTLSRSDQRIFQEGYTEFTNKTPFPIWICIHVAISAHTCYCNIKTVYVIYENSLRCPAQSIELRSSRITAQKYTAQFLFWLIVYTDARSSLT